MRAAFTAGLQDRLARGRLNLDQTKVRAVISSVRIDGDWATIGIRLEYLTGGNVPTGGGLAMARKLNQQWQLAFPGDPEFRPWLEDMPDSLLTPQQRRMFY